MKRKVTSEKGHVTGPPPSKLHVSFTSNFSIIYTHARKYTKDYCILYTKDVYKGFVTE